MSNPTDVQFGLAQAWLSMWTSSNELYQEQQEKWLRLATDVAHQYINERQTELRELQETHDWQMLTLLMPGVAARSVQNRVAVLQGICQTVATSQGALYTGWQQVARDYVQATQAALQTAPDSAAKPKGRK